MLKSGAVRASFAKPARVASSYPPCLRPRSFLLSNLGEEAVGPLADLVFSQPKSRGKNVCSSEFRVE